MKSSKVFRIILFKNIQRSTIKHKQLNKIRKITYEHTEKFNKGIGTIKTPKLKITIIELNNSIETTAGSIKKKQ